MAASGRDYTTAVISRINTKYARYGCDIVHVEGNDGILVYLKANPQKSKIGFLVEGLMGEGGGHYTPVYFERDASGKEYFVQLDSAIVEPCGFFKSNPDASKTFYYSPFPRQVKMPGCMEDGVKMLSHCFIESNFIGFCKNNCEKLVEEKSDTPALGNIFKLTSLPARFLANIERYDTLRHFREKEPHKFDEIYKDGETVRQRILREGEKRISDDPKHEDDFIGKCFLKRTNEYQAKAYEPHKKKKKKEVVEKFQKKEIKEINKFIRFKKSDIGKYEIQQYFLYVLPESWFDLRKFINPQIGTPIHFFMEIFTANWTVYGNFDNLLGHIENFTIRGVDINARDGEGSTVLTNLFRHTEKNNFDAHGRDMMSTKEFIKELVKRKASPHIRDQWGKNALDYARKKECDPEIIELFENCPRPVETVQPISLPLAEEKKHEQKNIFVTDYKKLFAGLGFIAAGMLTLSASTLLLAVTCGAAAPALLVSISLVVSMTGIAGGFVGVPLLERFGNKDSFNARMAAGSVVAGAGVGATTVIPQVSQAMGLTASNVSQVSGLMGGTAATTAAGSAAFVSTMVGIGAGVFAAFVLVLEGIRLIKNASKVSENPAALFTRPKTIDLSRDAAQYRSLRGSINR